VTKPFIDIKNISELCKVLGLPKSHAARVEIRRDLVLAIHAKIKAKKLTHEKAAEIAGVGRTVITAIVNGNIAKISTDRLIDIADGLGLDLHIRVA
jgi:predicted XRE-type DNA-binding protein